MKQKTQNNNFTFIDLFAGIGGIRLGFESAGGECIFTSEWNKFSQQTYLENFRDNPGLSHSKNHEILGNF